MQEKREIVKKGCKTGGGARGGGERGSGPDDLRRARGGGMTSVGRGGGADDPSQCLGEIRQ